MLTRIDALISNDKLRYIQTDFPGIRYKLSDMKTRIENGEHITRAEAEYIGRAEKILSKVNPHYKKVIVNGQEAEVLFIYA